MADSNLKRNEPQSFHDNDPFAELTRIMARDSARQDAAADPFDIDLEKELLGDLETSFADSDELAGVEGAPSIGYAGAEDYEADAPLMVEEDETRLETAAATAPVETVVSDGEPIAPEAFDEIFASEFDEEREWLEPGEVATAGPEAAGPAWETEHSAVAASPVKPSQDGAQDDLGLADVDMDFGDLNVSEEEIAAALDEPVREVAVAHAPAHPARELENAAAEWAPAAQDELSLEDELGLLLSDESTERADPSAAGDQDTFDKWQLDDRAPQAEMAPHIPLYGRANYNRPANDQSYEADYSPEPEARQVESLVSNDGWAQEPAWDELEAETPDEQYEADTAAIEASGAEERAAEAEPQPDPFAIFSTIVPAAQPAFAAPMSSAQRFDAHEEFETVEVLEAAVPLQDDLELPEAHAAEELPTVYDDYDVEFAQVFGDPGHEPAPQAVAEPAGSESDDRFFAELGFDGTAGGGAETVETHAASAWYDGEQDYLREAPSQDESELEREIDVAAYGAASAVPAAARSRTGMYVAAAVVAVAVLGGVGAFALSSGGGGGTEPVLVKADVEPLKVKPENPGGTSVPNQDSKVYERVAGNTSDRPAAQERLVSSTEEPVDLVARAQPVPAEEEFVLPGVDEDITSLSEAEIEVAAKAEDRIELPSPEAVGVGAAEDLAAVQPRRVRTMIVRPDGTLVPREDPAPAEAAAAQEAPMASAEPVAADESLLQPVQQLAAAVAEPAAQTIREVSTQAQAAASTNEAPAQPANGQTAPVAAASTEVVTPSTGPIVPQRPGAQQPQQQAQPPQQQVAQATAPARAQPAAPQPPAAAGEWSMQIASQPTADAAQATYQDLARRYGNVIGSHGVNIVRADIPGKGTYYRVRIPSSTRAEAISLCEKYKAAGGSCFVSK